MTSYPPIFPTITMITAGTLGLMYLVKSLRIVSYRFSERVSLGAPNDSANPLFRATRAHGNFAEFVPLMLFMLFLLESIGTNPLLLQICAGLLVIARLLQWIGILNTKVPNWQRAGGAVVTFILLGLFSVLLLLKALP